MFHWALMLAHDWAKGVNNISFDSIRAADKKLNCHQSCSGLIYNDLF